MSNKSNIIKSLKKGVRKVSLVFFALILTLSILPSNFTMIKADDESSQDETTAVWYQIAEKTVGTVTQSTDTSTVVSVVSIENGSKQSILDTMTTNEAPKGYEEHKESGLNPLGYNYGDSYMATVMSELLLVRSYDGKASSVLLDKYVNSTYERKGNTYGRTPVANTKYYDSDDTFNGASVSTNNGTLITNFESASIVDQNVNYSLIRAVAFNAFGGSRDDCVAYVALEPVDDDNARFITWMYDYTNKVQSEIVTIGTLNWEDIDTELYGHEMLNFMTVTAGDYYGKGKDSVVLYFPGHGNNSTGDTGLVEINWSKDSNGNITYSMSDISETLIHPLYTTGGEDQNWQKSDNPYDKLCATLDSGDLNGDGIEDLVVLTNMCWADSDDSRDMRRFVPYLAVSYGSNAEDASIIKTKTSGTYVEAISDAYSDGYTYWDSPRNPGLSVGDADGDGYVEIAVAGTKVTQKGDNYSKDPSASHYNDDPWYYYKQFDNLAVGIYSATNGQVQTRYFSAKIAANKWKEGGLYDDQVQPRSGVEFVAINGQGKSEYLFIDGTVYGFETGSCEPYEAYTTEYFAEEDYAADWRTIKNAYIQTVVAGNFDNNWAGREQLMILIGYKSNSYHNDNSALMTIGGVYDDDEASADGQSQTTYNDNTGFYSSDMLEYAAYLCIDEDSDVKDRYSSEIVALDCDKDGLELEYKGIEYGYSDVQVQAVIQAAPSFEELGQNNGSTTYSVTGSYSISNGHTWSNTHTIQAVVSASVYEFADFGFDITAGFGGTFGSSHGWTKTQSTSFTASFSATTEDTVILRRCPVYYYTYEVKNIDGQTVEGVDPEITFTVGQAPVYIQISVDDYNNVIDDYNKIMESSTTNYDGSRPAKLVKIEDSTLLENEGNPWGYAKTLGGVGFDGSDSYICNDDNGTGNFTSTPTWISLGHSAGSTSVTLSETSASTSSWSNYSGFSMYVLVKAGHKCLNGGIYYSYSHQGTHSQSTTHSTGTGVSTSVSNINKSALIKDNSASSETIDAYSFDWAFAAGKIKTGEQTSDSGTTDMYVPLLHHIVKNISAPVSPVTLLSVTEKSVDGKKQITLTWKVAEDDNSGRKFYTAEELQYRVYIRNDATKSDWTSLSTAPLDVTINEDGTVSYSYFPDTSTTTPGNIFSFAVRCSIKENGVDALESINSNEMSLMFVTQGKSAYDIAVEEGFEGTVEEWLASLKGADGKSAFQIAQDKGYQGTEAEWLESLVGATGENGKSAYELACEYEGFKGTVEEWLESLYGEDGYSAYELAVQEGFEGTLSEWVKQLRGKTAYELYIESVTTDKLISSEEWYTLHTDENSWYDVYVEALKKTDESITPLSEDEFIKGCIDNGAAYNTYLNWASEFLKSNYPDLTEEEFSKIYQSIAEMKESEFKEATSGCTNAEEYALKYVELFNKAMNEYYDDGSYQDVVWDDVKENVISLL